MPSSMTFHQDYPQTFLKDQGPPTPRKVSALATQSYGCPFPKAQILAFNSELAKKFSSNPENLCFELKKIIQNETPGQYPNTQSPYWSNNYAGHQFGHWAGQLGDGRAITIGMPWDKNKNLFEWQLKGFGPTAFSRQGDGFAVLRSSLREYILSLTFEQLGIPTTSALCLAITGEKVQRDILYTGNIRPEPGAIVLRVAPSFLRFGTFEWLAWQKNGNVFSDLMQWLHRFHFPQFALSTPEGRLAWFHNLAQQTIDLVADWMQFGFVHGVMNTDNMSIHGLTLDFGPFGWLSDFDLDFTPNTSDARESRYAYGKQIDIAIWNLSRLAGAINSFDNKTESYLEILNQIQEQAALMIKARFAFKLGIETHDQAPSLVQILWPLLSRHRLDFTLFFRWLETQDPSPAKLQTAWPVLSYAPEIAPSFELIQWLETYVALPKTFDPTQPRNPFWIPRNHILFSCINELERQISSNTLRECKATALIKREENPLNSELDRLIKGLPNMLAPHPEEASFFNGNTTWPWAEKTPLWSLQTPGCNQLSCSS